MSDNGALFWMFIFFVLFYVYFDMRINNLKKELLAHYNIFEELLQQGLVKSHNGTFAPIRRKKKTPVVTPAPKQRQQEEFQVINPNYDFINGFTPTEEETKNGIENIKQLKGIEWFNGMSSSMYATVDFE